jgi:hypothetical protein
MMCCIPLMMGARGGQDSEIMFAGIIPFLMFFPGMIYAEGVPTHETGIISAYVIGMIGYSIATLVLIAVSITKFDKFAGRTRWSVEALSEYGRESVPAAAIPIAAEIIETPIQAEIVGES